MTYPTLIIHGLTQPDSGAFRELRLVREKVDATGNGAKAIVRDVDGNRYEIDVKVLHHAAPEHISL